MRDNAAGKREMNKPCEYLLNIDNTLTPSYIAKISRITCPRAAERTGKPNKCTKERMYLEFGFDTCYI